MTEPGSAVGHHRVLCFLKAVVECTEPAENETATLSGGDWWITQADRR